MSHTFTQGTKQAAMVGVAPPCRGSFGLSARSVCTIYIIWHLLKGCRTRCLKTAQRANAGTLNATRGLFINDIHTRWSLRVAVAGDAVKDSSPERDAQLSYLFFFLFIFFAIEKEKSSDGFFPGKRLWHEAWNMQPGGFIWKETTTNNNRMYLTIFFLLVEVSWSAVNYAAQKFRWDQSQTWHFALVANPLPSTLSVPSRQIWVGVDISARPTVSYRQFSPSVSTTQTPGCFHAGWKGFTWRGGRGARSLHSSLSEWHRAHSLQRWQFGQLDLSLEVWVTSVWECHFLDVAPTVWVVLRYHKTPWKVYAYASISWY